VLSNTYLVLVYYSKLIKLNMANSPISKLDEVVQYATPLFFILKEFRLNYICICTSFIHRKSIG
jgi:hypothetical protein